MSQVLERQQHWLTCSQYLPTDACTRWLRGGRRNANCRLDHAASGCSPGDILSLLRHMATMDTLAALGWSICATGAAGSSHVQAPARLVAQHQHPAEMRTVLALLSHGYLSYSVASDSKLCWRRAVALGRVVPPRRAIAASSAPEGEKVRNVLGWTQFLVTKS